MVLLGPLALTIVGQNVEMEGTALVFFGVSLVAVVILLYLLAKREGRPRW